MAQVNTALAEDLQGVDRVLWDLGHAKTKVGFSQRQDFPQNRIFPKALGFSPCSPDIVPSRSPGWVKPTEALCFQTMPG